MAPENVPIGDYFSRLNALYETLGNILHPMPKKPYKRWHEEKFAVEPDFALMVGKKSEDNTFSRPRGCIYFEKLNKEEHKAASAALMQYATGPDNFALLPPRFCKGEKKCQGHHFLEDIAENSLPADLSYCFIYFFS